MSERPDVAVPDEPPNLDVGEITRLLAAARCASPGAEEQLFMLVYDELRSVANHRLRRERGPITLEATALVHEAWLRLRDAVTALEDRRHFFGVAARSMRQILVDRYRSSRRLRRGGGELRDADVALDEIAEERGSETIDLVALDEALTALAEVDARMAQIVQLRYFAGLSVEDTADVLAISPRTVKREWMLARGWLHRRMS
ncbi:MAG: ECF-type sigma factor [Planctomycetota bacterium]